MVKDYYFPSCVFEDGQWSTRRTLCPQDLDTELANINEGTIVLSTNNEGLFRVRYGHQVNDYNRLDESIKGFADCLKHYLIGESYATEKEENEISEEYDETDYQGMGWVDTFGRP